MVLSRKLERSERDSTDKHFRRNKMTHLWQSLLQLSKNDSFSSIVSWSSKDCRVFKLNNSEKVAQRRGMLKRNKATSYKKLSRALPRRYHYQQGNIQKVPGKTYVYGLNKRPLTCEPGIRKSPQVKSAAQGNLASNVTTIRECWSQPVVPMSCCPHCLCPRFLPSTTPSSGVGRKILCQVVDPSLKQLVLPTEKTPSRTSIPVSVIQKTTTSKIDH